MEMVYGVCISYNCSHLACLPNEFKCGGFWKLNFDGNCFEKENEKYVECDALNRRGVETLLKCRCENDCVKQYSNLTSLLCINQWSIILKKNGTGSDDEEIKRVNYSLCTNYRCFMSRHSIQQKRQF